MGFSIRKAVFVGLLFSGIAVDFAGAACPEIKGNYLCVNNGVKGSLEIDFTEYGQDLRLYSVFTGRDVLNFMTDKIGHKFSQGGSPVMVSASCGVDAKMSVVTTTLDATQSMELEFSGIPAQFDLTLKVSGTGTAWACTAQLTPTPTKHFLF